MKGMAHELIVLCLWLSLEGHGQTQLAISFTDLTNQNAESLPWFTPLIWNDFTVHFPTVCIGLNQERYGALLSEATFSSTRLSAHWAAMTTKEDCFICVPLNRLPSEVNGGNVEEEKKIIQEEILPKSNQEPYDNDATKHTMTLLGALGSDLNINAFALNWRYEDGRLNDDIEEANYLMLRVVKELSISSPNEKPTDKDLYLTSTEFNHEEYGRSAENEMPSNPIYIASSSKKQTRYSSSIGHASRKPASSTTILRAQFGDAGMEAYIKAKAAREVLLLNTTEETCIECLLNEVKTHGKSSFQGELFDAAGNVRININVCVFRVIKNRSLNSRNREPEYPTSDMPFYVYGAGAQCHISHSLLKAPNIELGATNIKLTLDADLEDEELARGAILCLTGVPEAPMQPFPAKSSDDSSDFFFRPGQEFQVKI
ncbi:pyridoxal-dependent decarboxylase conserved domain protein [Aspergillus udagawae]|nr:pyridoxal-dependent decarboxylase conserved domain protein [Aspergillus udagawae]